MKKVIQRKFIFFTLLYLIFSMASLFPAAAQPEKRKGSTVEKNLDDAILNSTDHQKSDQKKNKRNSALENGMISSKWSIHGFVENENFFQLSEKLSGHNAAILKQEGRFNLNLRYGSDLYHAKIIMDYFNYNQDLNYAVPKESGSLEVQEAYLHAGDQWQIRLGKQLFHWGKADLFPVTNFLDQRDFREAFSQDKEDQRIGVYAVRGKFLWRILTVEGALVPVFSKPLYPQTDATGKKSFWQIVPESYTVNIPLERQILFGGKESFVLSPELKTDEQWDSTWKNFATAFRAGINLSFIDAFISYYHGPDQRTMLTPMAKLAGGVFPTPLSITDLIIRPQYEKVDLFGLETAFNVSRFSFRAEGSYTMQKTLLVKDKYEIIPVLENSAVVNYMIPATEKVPYFAYTIGVDANLWGEDGRVLIEWTQSMAGRDRKQFEPELFTDIVLVRVEDKFFSKCLIVETGALLRPYQKNFGYAPYLSLGWDFQNGLEFRIMAMLFGESAEPLLRIFKDNDYLSVKARYTF